MTLSNQNGARCSDGVICVAFRSRCLAPAPVPDPVVPTIARLSAFISKEAGCSVEAANDILEVLMEVFGVNETQLS
ncbi:hypothetical protein FQV39_30475 (plasmid) [Bosea sp. F3-2]|uniref:hypothetical protein n=1 Tax=Bosea sp. F3-2 TaxID=2599640 RepID=UPI0011F09904|nr:hypothetical protein [Bosea sp. F3-2]QEL26976.1 hypothetical protein FQV39_30475 [Bosea sp. F3-2]